MTKRILAYLLSLSMVAAFSPCITAYAEETPTSGDFGDAFHWEYADNTLTFSVNTTSSPSESTMLTDPNTFDVSVKAWDIYLPSVKHLVFDNNIDSIGLDIFQNFDKSDSVLETITCGESMTWRFKGDPLWDLGGSWYRTKNIKFIAPKYSPIDYFTYMNDFNFEASGVAENPYLKLKDENGKWEYIEDYNLMKIYSTDDSDWSYCGNWYGRYKNILISENAIAKVEPSSFLSQAMYGGTRTFIDTSYKPIVYCYPEYQYIDYLRDDGFSNNPVPVVVLGEANPELKGDATLDGNVDISDATATLTYYAQSAAGMKATFKNDEELDKFAYYLADTDTEGAEGSDISIQDATNILTYYAQSAAGLTPDWSSIIGS